MTRRTIPLLCLCVSALFAQYPNPAPATPQEQLRAAASAFEAGDMPASIRAYRAFLKDHTDAAEIRSNLGAALVANGQIKEGIAEYHIALEKMPNNSRVRMNLALAYYKIGQLPEAAKELEYLLALQPLNPKPALLLADCLLLSGQPQPAVGLLSPLSNEYPDDRAITYMLGVAHMKAGELDRAAVLLDRILRDGESAETEFLIGQLEFLRQNVASAADHLARAVKLNPKLPGAHSFYGQVLRSNARIEEAAEQYRLELEVNPYDYLANTEMAMMKKQEGDLPEALRYLARALQVRPTDPGALLQRASIYSTQGKIDLARQELESLTKHYPNFAEARAALATVYYKLKRTADGDREREAARRARSQAQPKPAPPKK